MNCYYSPDCAGSLGQCADYTYATKEQLDKLHKEHYETLNSAVNIHDYDEQDAITRKELEEAERKFGK